MDQSPVEWVARPEAKQARPETQPARPEAQPGGMYGRTDERKIAPSYRTWSPIGAAALTPPMKTKKKVEQGKGTTDHLMPLG